MNWMTVSTVMERLGANLAVYSTCRLRKSAESSVTRSPKRSENAPAPV